MKELTAHPTFKCNSGQRSVDIQEALEHTIPKGQTLRSSDKKPRSPGQEKIITERARLAAQSRQQRIRGLIESTRRAGEDMSEFQWGAEMNGPQIEEAFRGRKLVSGSWFDLKTDRSSSSSDLFYCFNPD